MINENLFSFVLGSPDIDADYIEDLSERPDVEPGSIWEKLLKAITSQVRKDGIRKSAILPGQSIASVTTNAIGNIYYDVSEMFYWYFEPDDPRNEFMRNQKQATILSPLRAAVKPTVESNLKDMQEAELLPPDADLLELTNTVTNDLTRYILNWQDWYYSRKEEEDLEEHYMAKALYKEIYVDSDYGDITNIDNYLDEDVDDPNDFGTMPYQEQDIEYP